MTQGHQDPLLAYRGQFPILSRYTYMISHSLGAMPRGVRERLQEFADLWNERGIQAWEEGWWEMPRRVGDVLGGILGAAPGTITMHQNVSVAESIVASCLDFSGRRNKVVYTDMNFPSVMYVWEARRRHGARIHMVPSDDGITVDTGRLVDAIDETTLVVPISHVLFRSAYIQDVAAVTAKAEKVGAMVVLDCYQSAGTVPFSLEDLGVHVAVGGSVKWLLGGPGAGYLYVRPDLINRFEPAITGWAAHAHPFDFTIGPIQYAEGIMRWMHGTPAVAPLYQCLPGYEMIREIGVEAIRAKSMRQTARMIEAARARGLRVNSPLDPHRRGGSVVIDVPGGERVCRELIRRGHLVDHRPGAGVRAAPHFYTTDDECDATIGEMAAIAAEIGAS
ncbi:MAG TPA: aminotransferase class V-fold PLP-dependent enzyme [Candidatus Polarisedimenticolia bacterium]|nr:aminotransferase class V-fold PLP-dependent enzyme [Candidatus Polarisedimenticolia bacterium]